MFVFWGLIKTTEIFRPEICAKTFTATQIAYAELNSCI